MNPRHRLTTTALLAALLAAVAGCRDYTTDLGQEPDVAMTSTSEPTNEPEPIERIERTDEEWREILTPEQYRILREKGTERAFTGEYWDTKIEGTYVCAGCGLELYSSDAKFDSGCGWPSFYEAVENEHLETAVDRGFGMVRTELMCNGCGGHLGHVFDDGPMPTGKRHCINSASIKLVPKKSTDAGE